jgi:hypothetical protein
MEKRAQQGEAWLLLRLLQTKFGELPDTVRERVESADEQTLLRWSERALTTDRLEDVLH